MVEDEIEFRGCKRDWLCMDRFDEDKKERKGWLTVFSSVFVH